MLQRVSRFLLISCMMSGRATLRAVTKQLKKKTGTVRIKVILRRNHVNIFAVEKQ